VPLSRPAAPDLAALRDAGIPAPSLFSAHCRRSNPKELLQLGESLDGTLLLYDALRARFHSIRIAKDPECPTCRRA
jgi:adenylyltransferase/sulfurtransferase